MQLIDNTYGPLPGSVANSRKFVVNYMRSRGFEVARDPKTEYLEKHSFYLRGEFVGWSYDAVMYLQPVLPSLVEMGVLSQRSKTRISFDLPSLELYNSLRDAVRELKNSSDHYDELVKKSRVQKVREYFRDRKDADAVLSQPSFDYTNRTFIRKEENPQCC
mgnify:CR=1 FL=1